VASGQASDPSGMALEGAMFPVVVDGWLSHSVAGRRWWDALNEERNDVGVEIKEGGDGPRRSPR
jgi:hypothetical protein